MIRYLKKKLNAITETDEFYIDKNNNRWNKNRFSLDEAITASKSLTDCTRCTNCKNCTECTDCYYCKNCTECSICLNCTDCTSCRRCTNCISCKICTGVVVGYCKIISENDKPKRDLKNYDDLRNYLSPAAEGERR